MSNLSEGAGPDPTAPVPRTAFRASNHLRRYMPLYVFGTVWAIGTWQPASGLIKLGLPALAFSVFGLVAEIGSDPILTPTQVQIEGAGMFAMLGLTAVWIAWNAAAHAAVQEAWK